MRRISCRRKGERSCGRRDGRGKHAASGRFGVAGLNRGDRGTAYPGHVPKWVLSDRKLAAIVRVGRRRAEEIISVRGTIADQTAKCKAV